MKRIFALAAILFSAIAAPALALDLDGAKAQGLVGERPDGYVGAVSSNPSGEVATLVSSVNTARKQQYTSIATKNAQPLTVVEKLAAEKLIQRLGSGQYYMDKGGNWVKK